MAENSKIKMHKTYYLANIYLAPANTIPFYSHCLLQVQHISFSCIRKTLKISPYEEYLLFYSFLAFGCYYNMALVADCLLLEFIVIFCPVLMSLESVTPWLSSGCGCGRARAAR